MSAPQDPIESPADDLAELVLRVPEEELDAAAREPEA
jgi:hypothetical protein